MKAWSRVFSGLAFAALALAVVLAGAAPAGAQPGRGNGPGFGSGPGFGMHRPPLERMLGPGGMGRWWNNPKVIDRLKLTDEQRKDMDHILLQHREELIDMRANVEKAELSMEPLVSADQPNEQAILAQIDKIAMARADLEKANARFLLALRAKLTPEQFQELKTWREDRGQNMRMWRNRGQNGRRGPGSRMGPQGSPGPAPQGGPGAAPPPSGAGDPQSMLLPPGPNPAPEPGAID